MHRRKNIILWTWFVVALLVSISTIRVSPVSASSTVVSGSIIQDMSLTPGSTFSINISIANVENLWGYSFTLFYNTSILTATSESAYNPFTQKLFTRINETGGWVHMAYTMPMGTTIGFSTTEKTAMAKIEFTVNALGSSLLDLNDTKLSDPMGLEGEIILHDVHDGYFTNIEMPIHDIAITNFGAPTTVEVNGTVTVTATVENQGDFNETFDVSLHYGTTLLETKTNVTLSEGDSTTLSFTWNTIGVADGTYTLKATASVVPGEVETVDNIDTRTITIIGEEDTTPPDYTMLIVAAIAIVVIIAIVVYALKVRKPKAT